MTAPLVPFEELAPGVHCWSRWHDEKAMNFNGFLVVDPSGNVAIDPPELEARQFDLVWQLGGVAHVVLTNGHHGRRTADLVARTRARVHAPGRDVDLLHFEVDETFRGGDVLPADLRAIAVPHSKTPGETALLLPRDGGTLFLGDALIGRPPGALSLLPDEKFRDPAKARRGLRVLLEPSYARILVADGDHPEDGRAALEDFLAHAGVRPPRRPS